MKKRFLTTLVFQISMILLLTTPVHVCAAINIIPDVPKVNIYIEGSNHPIAYGEAYAQTFHEALEKFAASNQRLDLVFSDTDGVHKVHSVNGINDDYIENGGWYGCVFRAGSVLTPDDFLNMPLENNDDVILYYGDSNTKIISSLKCTDKNGILTFTAVTSYTTWDMQEGKWTSNIIEEPVFEARIHLVLPDGTNKILVTNEAGQASAKINAVGMYRYYAEGYVINSTPSILRTKDEYLFWGAEPDSNITRAQAASFVVNEFLVNKETGSPVFTDVNPSHIFYDDILSAAASGVISGYEDSTFKPEQQVNLMELCIMIARTDKKNDSNRVVENTVDSSTANELPDWSKQSVVYAVENKLLLGINQDWYGIVTADTLEKIYYNHRVQFNNL